MRKKILFKVNGSVVLEDSTNLFDNQIDEMKWKIAMDLNCSYDEIEIETLELKQELSEIDVTSEGLFYWRNPQFKIIEGLELTVLPTSDEFFDAIIDGNIDKYIRFI